MYAAVVEPSKIAQVLGLRRRITSIEQLDRQVEAGLPKASLGAVARHVYGTSPDAAALMQRVIPSATFHRRGEGLKPQEGERVERLARVIATAEHAWDSASTTRGHSCPPPTFAGAMLDCLAHTGIGRVPRTHMAVEIAIAATVTVERHDETSLPDGWGHADLRVARPFGNAWIRERRTAVLVAPSVVARREGNVLINPQHSDCTGIVAGTPQAVVWDARLFAPH